MVAKRATRRKTIEPEQAPELQRRRFSVDEYEHLIALGIVQEGERVELLQGEIYCMAAMGARHMACVTWLDRFFTLNVGAGALVRTQGPIRLPEDGEPEPDILVVRFRADFYRNRHPGPAEALLVIEVADTSVNIDRAHKLPLYAAAGIPESWLVDLPGQQIFVYREPRDGVYQQITAFKRGDTLTPLAFPDLKLAVDDVLGPADAA